MIDDVAATTCTWSRVIGMPVVLWLASALTFAGPAQAVIQALRASLGCTVLCGDVDRSGVVDLGDIARVRQFLIGLPPEAPFELARCSVSGADRGCNIADLARLRRLVAGGPVNVQSDCQMADGHVAGF